MAPAPQTPIPQFPSSSEDLSDKSSISQPISQLFKKLNIEEGSNDYAKVKELGQSGVATNIMTNTFKISGDDIQSHVYQFELGIFFNLKRKNGQMVTIEFNRVNMGNFKIDDYHSQTLKVMMIKLFPMVQYILKTETGIPEHASISDFHRLFFTIDERLKMKTEAQKGVWEVDVPADYINFVKGISGNRLDSLQSAKLRFKFTSEFNFNQCLLGDSVNSNQGMQFLNLLVDMKSNMNFDEWARYENGRTYLINPENHGFRDSDMPPLPDGKYLGIGSVSSVRQATDVQKNDPGFIYVVDLVKTAFHAPQPLNEKFDELLKKYGQGGRTERMRFTGQVADKVLKNLKGLVCHCIHLNGKEMKIDSVESAGADTKIIVVDNEQMTVQDYYLKRYNIPLRYPSYPLIVQKTKRMENGKEVKGLNYYPMELLQVSDYQRVKQKAQTQDQIKAMIRACSTNPTKRIDSIRLLFRALQVSNNEFLNYVNLKVEENPKKVVGRILEAPKIAYANDRLVTTKPDNKSWDLGHQNQFFKPSKITNWGCYYFEPVGMEKITHADIRQFVDQFTRQARHRGILMENCYEIKQVANDEGHLEKLFDYLASEKADFALFLTPDVITGMHQYIKLFERLYGVTTQDIRHSTVKNVIFKRQFKTLDNIVMKTNVKVGGLNYSLLNADREVVIGKGKLIIGIGFNHTKNSSLDAFSTVGFAANTTKNPVEFVGDVCFTSYQNDGRITFYAPVITTIMENYLKLNDEPKEVIIYRTSGSEGKYDEYLRWEIPFIKHLLQTGAPNAKLTFIVVEKTHNLRFFKENINRNDKAPGQNVVPGTVVDNGIVRTKLCEFYLNAHSGLQGTVKTPRYAILMDENNYSMDELQNLTNALSYDYQIVNLPISLPAPVYIANQYADRGRMTLKAHEKDYSNENNHEKIYEDLGYKNSPFNNKRVNA